MTNLRNLGDRPADPDGKPRPVAHGNASQSIFRGHIPELDALRAVGITIVILAHTWPYSSRAGWNALQTGWIMMDSFFVLSGFLIAGILLDSRSKPDYFRTFYTRRAARIFPIYWAIVLPIVLILTLWGGAAYSSMRAEWGSAWWFVAYLGNIPTALTGKWPFAASGSLIPLWSVQVEEQFYLLLPLLIYRLNPRTTARVLIGLACLSPIVRIAIYFAYPANELAQYVLLPCRMEGFALGAWIAIRFRLGPWDLPKRRLNIYTALWVAASILFAVWGGFSHTTPLNRTIGSLISSIASAYGVLWLILHRDSRTTRWLRAKPVQDIGKTSYGMYLMHWPLIAVFTAVGDRLGWKSLSEGHLMIPFVYASTVGCAALSWRYFESPLLRMRDRLAKRSVPAASAPRGPQGTPEAVLTRP